MSTAPRDPATGRFGYTDPNTALRAVLTARRGRGPVIVRPKPEPPKPEPHDLGALLRRAIGTP